MPKAACSFSPNFASRANIWRFARELAIAYQEAVWPFFGFCFVQTAACSERGAEAIVRRYRSSGMSPRPMCSSIAGWMFPRSRSLRTCRSGTAKAVAIASSVQFFEARSSIDRQRSMGDIGARTTFSATARMSSSGSAGLTRIAISLSLLAMALLMRRRPAMMVRVPSSSSEKSGG